MMVYAADCGCASMEYRRSGAFFVPGRPQPPGIVEQYPDTPDGVVRASKSVERHGQEEDRTGRWLYWCVHVGARHVLPPL